MKNILTILTSVMILGVLLSFMVTSPNVGNNHPAQKELTGVEFDEVHVGSLFKVKLIQADEYRVSVKISKNLEPYLVLKVEDGKLVAEMDMAGWTGRKMGFKDHAELYVYAPSIEELDLMGASQVLFAGKWNLDEVEMEVSGASELKCDDLEARKLSIEQSGATSVKASLAVEELEVETSGSCKMVLDNRERKVGSSLDLKVSGASMVDLSKLRFDHVKMDVSGASKVIVFPLKGLEGKVSGACSVEYNMSSGELRKSIDESVLSSVVGYR